jgi:hypothetical protein
VNRRKFHEIWIEQCDAAQEIKLRYGLKAALDYIVAEKLLNFADAAASDPEFARELPRFIARVKGLFTPQEIRTQLDRIGHELREYDADIEEGDNFSRADELREEDELIIESPAAAGARSAVRHHPRIIDRRRAWDIVKPGFRSCRQTIREPPYGGVSNWCGDAVQRLRSHASLA